MVRPNPTPQPSLTHQQPPIGSPSLGLDTTAAFAAKFKSWSKPFPVYSALGDLCPCNILGQKKCNPRKLNQNFSLLLKQSCFIWPWASSRRQSHPYILAQLEPGLCWCGKHFLRSTEFTFKLRRAQRRSGRFWWYFYTKQQPTIQTADTVLVLRNLEPVWGKKLQDVP